MSLADDQTVESAAMLVMRARAPTEKLLRTLQQDAEDLARPSGSLSDEAAAAGRQAMEQAALASRRVLAALEAAAEHAGSSDCGT